MPLLVDVCRCLLIYAHLLLFGVAIALVIWGDLRILRGVMTDNDYAYVGTLITRLFLGLWVTGLTIIYIDTGFDTALLAERPKLLTKLSCILILTLNAIVLHKVCMKILMSKSAVSISQALTLSICGSISTSHWLLAAFVGSASMLSQFSFSALITAYLCTLSGIVLVGIAITPLMQQRLNQQRAEKIMDSLHLRTVPTKDIRPINPDVPANRHLSIVPSRQH